MGPPAAPLVCAVVGVGWVSMGSRARACTIGPNPQTLPLHPRREGGRPLQPVDTLPKQLKI